MSGQLTVGVWGWIAMVAVLTVVWTAAVVVIAWQLRPGAGRGSAADAPRADGNDDPLAIAQRAYARGELSRERYFEVVEDLHGAVHRPRTPA